MGALGKKIKKAVRKAGRALGGPVTASVDAGRAIKQGKGAKGAAKAFGKAVQPGASVQEMHQAHVDAASAVTAQVLGDAAAGRVDDFGRMTKPTVGSMGDPVRTAETLGSAAKAAKNGDLRQAGRSLGRVVTQDAVDKLARAAEPGQALGDLLDGDASRRLDERLLPVLRRVFGTGLDFDRLRFKRGRPGPGQRRSTTATTMPSLIYLGDREQFAVDASGMPRRIRLVPEGEVLVPDAVLVHELVHAWQNEHGGPNYLSEAAFGYGAHGLEASYRWWNFTDQHRALRIDDRRGVGRQGRTWRAMPVEPQAEFIQHAFELGAFWPDAAAPEYLQLRIRDTDLPSWPDQRSYAAAFGSGVELDWSDFLKAAVRDLHRGRFRR